MGVYWLSRKRRRSDTVTHGRNSLLEPEKFTLMLHAPLQSDFLAFYETYGVMLHPPGHLKGFLWFTIHHRDHES